MQLDLTSIGNYIRERRVEAKLTQAALAERLGVSFQAISNWERGESLPDTALLPDLACILDCSIDIILGGGTAPGRYRRRITVAQMREAINCIRRMRELLGPDHFMCRTMIDALNVRMNSDIEPAFSDEFIFDAYIGEAILACVRDGGDYIDLNDVSANLMDGKPKEYILRRLKDLGIK